MLKFLFFSALVLAAVTVGAPVFFPLVILALVIWVVTLPFRLVFGLIGGLFHLLFGLIGAVIGLLAAPLLLLVGLPLLLVGLVLGAATLLVPLAPVLILSLIVWGFFRMVRPRPRTA